MFCSLSKTLPFHQIACTVEAPPDIFSVHSSRSMLQQSSLILEFFQNAVFSCCFVGLLVRQHALGSRGVRCWLWSICLFIYFLLRVRVNELNT